jgi:hypothetical protein
LNDSSALLNGACEISHKHSAKCIVNGTPVAEIAQDVKETGDKKKDKKKTKKSKDTAAD